MKRLSILTLIFTSFFLVMAGAAAGAELAGQATPPEEPLSLWYRRPASQWVEALPIGNGRLGAMIFGRLDNERIQLNEGTLWGGGPYDPNNPELCKALPEARRLIFQGKYAEVDRLLNATMMARPIDQVPYQPLGDLRLRFAGQAQVANYRRDLNLDSAIATVSYTAGGVTYTREAFASPVDQVIVIRLAANRPGQLAFAASLGSPQSVAVETAGSDTLVMRGSDGEAMGIPGALKFQARVRVLATGGKTTAKDRELSVTGADSATLLVAAATSYKSYNDISGDPELLAKNCLAAAGKKTYDALRRDHVAEHRRLFRRVALDLGATPAAACPTDERIKHYSATSDPQLAALYFQFGRYLLISCSRPGGQPATLQGLWNESMGPPWGSNYTIDANTEMNYWPAEPTNLGECMEPLTAMVLDLTHTGARTATINWGARGWVSHSVTGLWRISAPIGGSSGFWPMGGAWLLQNVWDHYEYNPDPKFLARIYPALKGASQFFLDTLVEEPRHKWLVTCPSMSPENVHPKGVWTCAGPTMDMQILRDLFAHTIRAAEVLGVDAEFRRQVAAARARLAPNRIGKAGQLQEWLDDWDMEAPERTHRHVSHLYGLFPSDQISLRATPELAAAVRKSLELRGDGGEGFALAWRVNLWARLGDGNHACKVLGLMLRPGGTLPNMGDSYTGVFQIDGNFGGASGIAEMLLRSRAGEIELLPALPKTWPSGSVKGLRARGGFEVDVAWRDGKLLSAKVRSLAGQPCLLCYGTATRPLSLKPGEEMPWDGR